MADAARTMPPPRSSTRSVSDVRSTATWVAGTLMPNTAATANTITASTSTPWLPATRKARPPGSAAANVTTPDRNDRRELASISSSSDRTTVGTMADLATW